MIKKQLGKRIKEIRKIKRLTQEELAEKADMATSYIAMIERGEKNPTLNFIEKIATGLDVNLYQLFSFTIEGLKSKKEASIEELHNLLNLSPYIRKASLSIIRIIKEIQDE